MIGMQKNDIIMDFFSGSATTAHAVMQLNAEDNGTRKFIMVQLPEETDENAQKRNAPVEVPFSEAELEELAYLLKRKKEDLIPREEV